MNGHEYEYQVAKYLRGHGYTGVTVTKGSGDFGVDVIAHKGGHKYAVQCKYYSNSVGLSAVQEAVTGMAYYKCDRAMVVTNSSFTKAARDLARANNVLLLDGVRSAGASGFRGLPKGVKLLLLGAYLFAASALFVAMLNVVKGQPFWKATYNVVTTMAFMLFPLWIGPAIRGVKRLFRSLIHKAPKETAKEATPINTPTPAPVVVKRVDESKVRSALMLIGSEFYSADLSNFICEQRISISVIQRRLKVGYNRATVILDTLREQGLVSPTTTNGYEWTEKALLRSAEGLNG